DLPGRGSRVRPVLSRQAGARADTAGGAPSSSRAGAAEPPRDRPIRARGACRSGATDTTAVTGAAGATGRLRPGRLSRTLGARHLWRRRAARPGAARVLGARCDDGPSLDRTAGP